MICIIFGTSDGYEKEMSTFLKSAPLIRPKFLRVAFIGRDLNFSETLKTQILFSSDVTTFLSNHAKKIKKNCDDIASLRKRQKDEFKGIQNYNK